MKPPKHLKRLWTATGKPRVFFAVMVACLGVISWCWYRVSQRHDLHKVTSSYDYSLGVMASMTALLLAVTLGGAVGLLARRYTKPLPIDPDFPPYEVLYIQGDGKPERCACHGRVIKDGSVVLQWPQPPKFACVRERHTQ
jgi:hypothetical protein